MVFLSSASSLFYKVNAKERRAFGKERKVDKRGRKKERKKDTGEVFYWIYSEQAKT